MGKYGPAGTAFADMIVAFVSDMEFKRSHGICPNPSVVAVNRSITAEIVIFNIALSSRFDSVKTGILIYPMKTLVRQIETV
jgi:hypothetical protein